MRIDVESYMRMKGEDPDVGDVFDSWLRRHHLAERNIVDLELGEGFVRITRHGEWMRVAPSFDHQWVGFFPLYVTEIVRVCCPPPVAIRPWMVR